GQFKNWFYSLLAMSVALENKAPFKKLLGYGSVRDEKGEEMHKSKGNAIEFNEAAEKIGVDVMRWLYLRTKPEHNVNFGYHVADDIRRFFHLRLWNVYSFFVTYANIDKWKPGNKQFKPSNVLDKWVLSRLHGSVKNITDALERFDAADAASTLEIFVVNDLSNWYVRRIRERVSPAVINSQDKADAYQTLWLVLTTISKILAPMLPFIAEEIFTNLTRVESVHLADWPSSDRNFVDDNLEKQMVEARQIVEAGHGIRKDKGIKVRQPLSSLSYKLAKKLDQSIEKIIGEELNVKEVRFDSKQKEKVVFDTKLTSVLEKEGEARDLIRRVQEKRKEAGVTFSDEVLVYLPSWPREFGELIKRETLAKKLLRGD
ncbi:MAG: class I tRNA ligase family protein, partial [bacterium]|nr:class I tRNA ligase family protein [bacterium]